MRSYTGIGKSSQVLSKCFPVFSFLIYSQKLFEIR